MRRLQDYVVTVLPRALQSWGAQAGIGTAQEQASASGDGDSGGGGGGGGSDVEPGTADGQLLRWDATDERWVAGLYAFLSALGEMLLAPGSDVTALTIQMVNGQARPPFVITDENGVRLFSFGDDGSLTARPHDTGSPAILGYGYGSVGTQTAFAFRSLGARGSRSSPAALQSGDYEGEVTFGAQYDTTVDHYHNVNASIIGRAAENQDATHAGSYIQFLTTPLASTTIGELLRMASIGLGIKTLGANNAAAALQADSTSQGLLPPRMTTTQRDAISSPPAGLLIYNTTTNKLNVYTTAWEQVTSV